MRVGIVVGGDDEVLTPCINRHSPMERTLVTSVLFVEDNLIGRIGEGPTDVVLAVGVCKHTRVSSSKSVVNVNNSDLAQLVDIGPH